MEGDERFGRETKKKVDWEDEQEKGAWKKERFRAGKEQEYKTEQRRPQKQQDRVMERNTGEAEKRKERGEDKLRKQGRTNGKKT